jgi:NTP pyrophosphatase (non-canonical NTP hydrolase)
MEIAKFQRHIEDIYFARDNARGLGGTFMWFTEEVGELATALRENDKEAMKGEFADVLAWLCTLASIAGISMEEVIAKYAKGCCGCGKMPCECQNEKP